MLCNYFTHLGSGSDKTIIRAVVPARSDPLEGDPLRRPSGHTPSGKLVGLPKPKLFEVP